MRLILFNSDNRVHSPQRPCCPCQGDHRQGESGVVGANEAIADRDGTRQEGDAGGGAVELPSLRTMAGRWGNPAASRIFATTRCTCRVRLTAEVPQGRCIFRFRSGLSRMTCSPTATAISREPRTPTFTVCARVGVLFPCCRRAAAPTASHSSFVAFLYRLFTTKNA